MAHENSVPQNKLPPAMMTGVDASSPPPSPSLAMSTTSDLDVSSGATGTDLVALPELDMTSEATGTDLVAQSGLDMTSEATGTYLVAQSELDVTSEATGTDLVAQSGLDMSSGATGTDLVALPELDMTSGATSTVLVAQSELNITSEAIGTDLAAQSELDMTSEATSKDLVAQSELDMASGATSKYLALPEPGMRSEATGIDLVALLKLQVSPSLRPQRVSLIDDLVNQIKSGTFELKKRDQDVQNAEEHVSAARSELEMQMKLYAKQLEDLSAMLSATIASQIFTLPSAMQHEHDKTSCKTEDSGPAQNSEAQRQRSTTSNSHIGYSCSTDHQRLQMDNYRLRKKCDETERAVKNLQSELAASKSREKILARNLEVIKMGLQSNSTSSNVGMASVIEQLAKQVEELEKEKNMLAPLVRVGAAVRLRNLEQALETVMDVRHRDLNQATIKAGNIAAHRANGLADCALFEGGFVAEEFMEKATEVFQKLYQVPPSAYQHFDPRSRRVIDCQATMATCTRNTYNSNTADLRLRYVVLDGELTRMINGEMPSTSETIDELLGHLETIDGLLCHIERITEDIVDIERSGNRRRFLAHDVRGA